MSQDRLPREALSSIPGFETGTSSVRELGGGLTNRSYLIKRGKELFVLRLDSRHTKLFGLDRQCEVAVLRRATAGGLAPDVVFADPDAGILLSRYVAGRTWRVMDLHDSGRVDALADLLRRVHALPICGTAFDAVGIAQRYLDNLEARPELYGVGARCVEIVAGIGAPAAVRCCHNDVVAENVIAYPRPLLIDWEYASDNDPLFDLASLIGFHDLGDRAVEKLLGAYLGGSDPESSERLRTQRRLYDALQWLWLANRQTVTSTAPQANRLLQLKERIV